MEWHCSSYFGNVNKISEMLIKKKKEGLKFYGTGSNPCPPQGWQRAILLIASNKPRPAPYFLIASTAYSEQVGVYRQLAGVSGEMQKR